MEGLSLTLPWQVRGQAPAPHLGPLGGPRPTQTLSFVPAAKASAVMLRLAQGGQLRGGALAAKIIGTKRK